ncbi:MAG: hypothetical protein RIR48_1258 [Bacteroidota bacterium]
MSVLCLRSMVAKYFFESKSNIIIFMEYCMLDVIHKYTIFYSFL